MTKKRSWAFLALAVIGVGLAIFIGNIRASADATSTPLNLPSCALQKGPTGSAGLGTPKKIPGLGNTGIPIPQMVWPANCLKISIIDRAQVRVDLPQGSSQQLSPNGKFNLNYGQFLTGVWTLGYIGGDQPVGLYCKPGLDCTGSAINLNIIDGASSFSTFKGNPDGLYSAGNITSDFNRDAWLTIGGYGEGAMGQLALGQTVCAAPQGFSIDNILGAGIGINIDGSGKITWQCSPGSNPGAFNYASPIINLAQNIDPATLNNYNVTYSSSSDSTVLQNVFVNSGDYYASDATNWIWCQSINKYVLGQDKGACSNTASLHTLKLADHSAQPSDFAGLGTTKASDVDPNGLTTRTFLVSKSGGLNIPGVVSCPQGGFADSKDACKNLSTAGSGSGNSSGSGGSQLDCTFDNNPLTWIVCPVVDGINSIAARLDKFINDQLEFDSSNYNNGPTENGTTFFDNTKGAHGTNPYYTAWNSFRVIATAMIVIAGLFMVASQALGFEFLDAYTIRKTLPRLLVAIIGISLSWPVMSFLVGFFNTLGKDIEAIMFAPFGSGPTGAGGFHLFATATGASAGAIGGGLLLAGLGLGIIGALSFGLTALLAFLVGFLIIIARNVALILILIFAPIGIAAYILPNTQKLWKLWSDNFFGLLLVYPIITAMIAAGKIFSWAALSGTSDTNLLINNLALTVMGFVAYLLPYFALPLAFRMATGAIGSLAGFMNDRGRGAFDRLKKFRGAKLAENMSNLKAGSRFNPNSRLTRYTGGNVVNRVGAHAGAGVKGRFGFGATGAAARGNNAFATKESMAKENAAFGAQVENEDAMIAVAMGNDRRRMAQLSHFRNADGSVNEAKLNSALAAGRSIGSNQRMQVAALDALSKSGKVIGNQQELDTVLDSVSRGNGALRGGLEGNYRFNSRQVGRSDLGRRTSNELVRELDANTISRLKPRGAENIFGAGGAWEQAFRTADNDEARQHMVDELYASQYSPNMSPEVHEHLDRLISRMPGLLTSDGALHGTPQMVGGQAVVDPATGRPLTTGQNYWEEAGRRYSAKYSNPRSPGPGPGPGPAPPPPPTPGS